MIYFILTSTGISWWRDMFYAACIPMHGMSEVSMSFPFPVSNNVEVPHMQKRCHLSSNGQYVWTRNGLWPWVIWLYSEIITAYWPDSIQVSVKSTSSSLFGPENFHLQISFWFRVHVELYWLPMLCWGLYRHIIGIGSHPRRTGLTSSLRPNIFV